MLDVHDSCRPVQIHHESLVCKYSLQDVVTEHDLSVILFVHVLFWQTMKEWFAEFSDEQKNLVLREFLVCMMNIKVMVTSLYVCLQKAPTDFTMRYYFYFSLITS